MPTFRKVISWSRHQYKLYVSLQGYGTWQEEMDSDEMMRKNMYEVNRDGYGRLKLLEMVIRDQIQDGTLTCGGLDETGRLSDN